MDKIDKVLAWFRDDENLTNVRTGASVTFILLFVLYFYGFRSGFDVFAINVFDLITDIAIVITSSVIIINDFALRGISVELKEEGSKIKTLLTEHSNVTKVLATQEKASHAKLREYNKLEYQRAVDKKKDKLIKDLEYQRRKYVGEDTKRAKRKIASFEREIKRISNSKYKVKVKHKDITLNDLYKRGALKERDNKVNVNYSPLKDTITSQSSIVLITVVFTSMVRFAIDPSWENAMQGLLFLSFLIPFLLLRAVTSYQIARYNTENKYPQAIQKQISIINEITK